jgi:hypothetical protein
MKTPLCELQRQFAAGVFEESDAVLARLRDGVFPAARHLQIYRNNIFTRFTDALGESYPVVQRLVGEGFFRFLSEAYLRRHPSRTGNLFDYGSALPEFLAAFEPARSLPYLPDVARLEWAWHESYHAADAAPLNPETLGAVSPEFYAHIVFHLHPSARLLRSAFPCLRIWQVNQPDFDGEPAVNLDAGAEQLLVIRHGLEVAIRALGAGEYAMLRAFADGKTFGEAADEAVAVEPGFDLGAALRRHVAARTVTGFDVDPEPKGAKPEHETGECSSARSAAAQGAD